jgi:hypothetical protein
MRFSHYPHRSVSLAAVAGWARGNDVVRGVSAPTTDRDHVVLFKVRVTPKAVRAPVSEVHQDLAPLDVGQRRGERGLARVPPLDVDVRAIRVVARPLQSAFSDDVRVLRVVPELRRGDSRRMVKRPIARTGDGLRPVFPISRSRSALSVLSVPRVGRSSDLTLASFAPRAQTVRASLVVTEDPSFAAPRAPLHGSISTTLGG